jgi:uncharacterized protein (TIGR02466 family)
MTAEIQPLFATAVYKNILRPLTPEELDFIQSRPRAPQGSGNLMSRSREVLEFNELADLKKLFLENIKEYAETIMGISNELYITSSWISFTEAKQGHNLHNHPNSILSGCFYVDVEKSQPSITFNSMTSPFLFSMMPKTFNSFNSAKWSVPVKDNMLLLFPSSCFHSVDVNHTPNTRISISFDTFIKGTVGTTGSELYLK